jgi:sensor domain CHASE-containing protein
MNTLFYVVCIVAVVMTATTIQKIARLRLEKNASDEITNAETERLDQLEERIRVLERIVTEDKHDLRREINRL